MKTATSPAAGGSPPTPRGRRRRRALTHGSCRATPVYQDRGKLTCGSYAHWADVPIQAGELYPRDQRFVIAFPTNDDLTVVFVASPYADAAAFRRDVTSSYLAALDLAPGLADRVHAAPSPVVWSVPPTCQTSSANPSAPGGPWSETPATTKTR